MLWGHRNDPVNFHRCLQDFDRRLPDLLDALRDGDLLILTSDHGCDPTTPSTDHSREHALLLAYAAGKNAAGRHPRGRRVRRRRRDRQRLARRQAPGQGRSRAGRSSSGEARRPGGRRAREYATETGLAARRSLYANADGPDPREIAFEAVAEMRPEARARGRLRPRRARRADRHASSRPRSSRSTVSPRMVELARGRGRRRAASATSRACRFADEAFDCAVAAWMLYHVPDLDRGARASWRACCGPAGGSSPPRTRADHLQELSRARRAARRSERVFTRENGAEIARAALRARRAPRRATAR